jgi:ribosomal protein L44E
MKSILIIALTFFARSAYAESAAELTCKAQAKEIAVQTYSSCITESRNSQIEQIRKSYKEELANLKSKYDRELKKMGSTATKATAPNKTTATKGKRSAPTVQEITETIEAPKASKGIARQLPTRRVTRELPLKTVTESDNMGSSVIDRESTDAEGVEYIPMPEVEETPAT